MRSFKILSLVVLAGMYQFGCVSENAHEKNFLKPNENGGIDTQEKITLDNNGYHEYLDMNQEEVTDPKCGPFTILDSNGDKYEVGSILNFKLNSQSPNGYVGNGVYPVIVVDVTANCGDIILTEANIVIDGSQEPLECDQSNYAPDVYSSLEYIDEGELVHETFPGKDDCRAVDYSCLDDSSVSMLWWSGLCPNGILIQEGETVTLTMSVDFSSSAFGGTGIFGGIFAPKHPFVFSMTDLQSWYGLDNPSSYPENIVGNAVQGSELRYLP